MENNKIMLNEVEGFDPLAYVRTIQNDDGTESLYLDVPVRILWFRLCNPTGKIEKIIHNYDGNSACIEARVYLDYKDPPESFLANGFAQRSIDTSNPNYGNRFLESAETAAVGRALANAGYGVPFCIEKDTTPADSGMRIPNTKPVTVSTPESRCSGNTTIDNVVDEPKPTPQQTQNPTSRQTQQSESQNKSPVMTLNQALNYVIKSGKHRGKTVGQLAVEDPSYFDWVLNNYKGNDPKLKEAVEFVAANR